MYDAERWGPRIDAQDEKMHGSSVAVNTWSVQWRVPEGITLASHARADSLPPIPCCPAAPRKSSFARRRMKEYIQEEASNRKGQFRS